MSSSEIFIFSTQNHPLCYLLGSPLIRIIGTEAHDRTLPGMLCGLYV